MYKRGDLVRNIFAVDDNGVGIILKVERGSGPFSPSIFLVKWLDPSIASLSTTLSAESTSWNFQEWLERIND